MDDKTIFLNCKEDIVKVLSKLLGESYDGVISKIIKLVIRLDYGEFNGSRQFAYDDWIQAMVSIHTNPYSLTSDENVAKEIRDVIRVHIGYLWDCKYLHSVDRNSEQLEHLRLKMHCHISDMTGVSLDDVTAIMNTFTNNHRSDTVVIGDELIIKN